MKNSLFFLFFLSVITILNAQQETELQGIVVEQNSKFNTGVVVYLDKTTINVPGAKISVVSDEKGGFKLILKDKFIGDITCINASKSNYQLVNDEELKEVIILESKMPLKVILSKKGKLYENQLNYIKDSLPVSKL